VSSHIGVVYVPSTAARNLDLGLRVPVWGFTEVLMARSNYLEQFRRLEVGDLFFLGHAGPSNRVPPGGWRNARLRSGHLGVVTALTETATEPVWPDALYPYRPSFDLVEEMSDVGADTVGEEVMEALRLSSNQQGRPVILSLNVPLLATRQPRETPDEVTLEGALDAMAYVRRRREQGHLRRLKLGSATDAACDLCARSLPVRHLRVAHVKPRFRCSEEEKRDPANVMIACVECDALFEQGDLVVADDGTILPGGGAGHVTPDLEQLVLARTRRRCTAHTTASARYFAQRREQLGL
jgi:hypothetical protein